MAFSNITPKHLLDIAGAKQSDTMIEECNESLLRKFDTNQDNLWMWNSSKGKSGGILVGVLLETFDVGSLKKENSCYN